MGGMSAASALKVAVEEVCVATGRDCSWCSCSWFTSLEDERSGWLPFSMRERERERERERGIGLIRCRGLITSKL